MIERLEKIEQLTQEYHLEKAAGFFIAQIKKRRFIRQLWKKRDEDEVKKLGVTSSSHFEFGSPTSTATESPITFLRDRRNKKLSAKVPRIVIDNVAAITSQSSPTPSGNSLPPVSPMSNYSMDNQYDPYYSGGGHSLSVAPGTSSIPSSPNTEFDGSSRLGGLSPYSPLPNLSPGSRQNWLLIDGNVDMPTDISESLMDSMNHSMWSGKRIYLLSFRYKLLTTFFLSRYVERRNQPIGYKTNYNIPALHTHTHTYTYTRTHTYIFHFVSVIYI